MPDESEEAEPPPKPINMAGPPKTIKRDSSSVSHLSTDEPEILPKPPIIIIGL